MLAHPHGDIQRKTYDVASIGRQIGLNINTNKTKLMKINSKSNQQVIVNNNVIEEVKEFIYLGCKITTEKFSDMDVLHRSSKARGAFAAL